MGPPQTAPFTKLNGENMKKFRVQIFAYQLKADFIIESLDGPIDIENAIIDKLGKNDIKWEYLGEMHDPRVNRITYEEVINGDTLCLIPESNNIILPVSGSTV